MLIAKSNQSIKPKKNIQQIERHKKQDQLLPKMHCLVAYLVFLERFAVIKYEREYRYGVIGSRWKTARMYQYG